MTFNAGVYDVEKY